MAFVQTLLGKIIRIVIVQTDKTYFPAALRALRFEPPTQLGVCEAARDDINAVDGRIACARAGQLQEVSNVPPGVGVDPVGNIRQCEAALQGDMTDKHRRTPGMLLPSGSKPPKFLANRVINVVSVRIAHVAPVIHPVPPQTYGGTERVIADLADAQVAQGHDVTVFCPADSALDGLTKVGDYHSLSWHERHASNVPAGLPAVLEAQLLRDLLEHGGDHDVLHLHGSAHASAIAGKLGLPVFRTIHWRADELDHHEHFRTFPDERIIAISHSQAKSVPSASLAGVAHHGMPSSRYRLGDGRGGYLAFLGRMTDQKRPDRAIELARSSGRVLKLAGPIDPGNPTYFETVVKPKLDDATYHVGNVNDEQKQDLLGNAAALIFPIDWPEPFGLVMIEAMACGTPVIAWREGSVAEVVEDGLTGIVVGSLKEATERLDEVFTLDRQRIRDRFEERFSSARMAREILDIYRAALPSRSSKESSARSPSP